MPRRQHITDERCMEVQQLCDAAKEWPTERLRMVLDLVDMGPATRADHLWADACEAVIVSRPVLR